MNVAHGKWLTQRLMAELYGVDPRTVNDHIEKIYQDGELTPEATIRKFRIVQQEGNRLVNRNLLHYNLQMIIAVGFKVNNERAVQFRKWANNIVKEYTIKGWVMDDIRLKEGGFLTDKYFDAQLERIREIRMSERKFYQKITDITLRRWIMTRKRQPPFASMPPSRINCTMPSMDILRRS